MSENLRTGAGAASRPREEDLIRERDSTTEKFVGDSSKGFLHHTPQPIDESPYIVNWVSYPIYNFPHIDPPLQDLSNPTVSAIYRPLGLEESDPTFYSVFARWPSEGGVRNLLGMFIRSRPKGSLMWRPEIDYRAFTEAYDQYSPARQNVPNNYSVQIEPDPGEEYQIATRYSWTPDFNEEFLSEIRDGATFPRQQPIMVVDKTGNGYGFYGEKEFIGVQSYYAIFGEIDVIEGYDYQRMPQGLGNLTDKEGIYWAKFADTKEPGQNDSGRNASSLGVLVIDRSTNFFTYAEDATGIVIID